MSARISLIGRVVALATTAALGASALSHSATLGSCVHLNLSLAVLQTMTVPGTPIGLTADDAGHLIVATSEGSVMSLSSIGNCSILSSVTLPGTGSPVAVTMNLVGDIYVAKNNGTIMRLNTGLTVLATQTVTGTPVDITVDQSGAVYIVNTGGTIFKRTSNLVSLATGTVTGTPTSIFADITGNIYVTTSGGAVHRLNTSLTTLASGTITGIPIDVSEDAAGNVVVATSGGGLFKISPSIAVLASRTGLAGTLTGVDLNDAGHVVSANTAGTVFLTNTSLAVPTSVSSGSPGSAVLITTAGHIFLVGGTGTVPTPTATFSAASALTVSPDPVLAGGSGTASLTVGNTGTGPLGISSAALTSTDPGNPWSLTPTAPPAITVNAGGPSRIFTATLTVPAALAADRTYTAALTIGSNDPMTPSKTITITGHGHVPRAKACYNLTNLPFGSVNKGISKTLQFTVSNCGELPLHIQSLSLTSLTPTVWSVTPAVPPVLTLPVSGAASSRQFNVTLSVPAGLAADAPYAAQIDVTTDDQVNPPVQTITANGTGHVPLARISIDPAYTDIDYRGVELGYHFSRALVVRNVGDLGLSFEVVHADPMDPDRPDFSLETDPGSFQIAPGGQQIFKQTFAPLSLGAKNIVLRVQNTNDATFSTLDLTLHGTGTPPVPIDAALVIDRSGSMSETAGDLIKIEVLRRSAILFTELLRDNVDHFGLTKYDHENSNIQDLGPIATVRANAQTLLNDVNNNAGIKPRGSTGIGGAMRTASAQFALQPDPTHRKAMIVLTDGVENQDPYIRDVLNGDASHQPLFTQFPDLLAYSIGLGVATNINADRLQEITNRGAGGTYHVTGDLTGLSLFNLENFFFKIFADAIGQQIVVDPTFSVALRATQEVPIPVITEDREALFFFIGELPQQEYVFELVDPAGQVISSTAAVGGMSVQVKSLNNWSFVRVQFPAPDINLEYVGTWLFRVRIANPGKWTRTGLESSHLSSTTFGAGGVHRMSIAASVGSSYRLTANVGPGVVMVSQPIALRATLTDGQWPSPTSTISATVRRPDGVVSTAPLFDDGLHGDGSAGDAVFGGTYGATQVGGVYDFHFVSQGTTARGEAARREALRSQFVGTPTPDPKPRPCLPCWLLRVLLILAVIALILLIIWGWRKGLFTRGKAVRR